MIIFRLFLRGFISRGSHTPSSWTKRDCRRAQQAQPRVGVFKVLIIYISSWKKQKNNTNVTQLNSKPGSLSKICFFFWFVFVCLFFGFVFCLFVFVLFCFVLNIGLLKAYLYVKSARLSCTDKWLGTLVHRQGTILYGYRTIPRWIGSVTVYGDRVICLVLVI